jgi:hypothetical protein
VEGLARRYPATGIICSGAKSSRKNFLEDEVQFNAFIMLLFSKRGIVTVN